MTNQDNFELPTGQSDIDSKLNNATKEFGKFKDNNPMFTMDPISRFPNILDSFVEVTEYNETLKAHGIMKRKPSILHLAIGANKSENYYLDYVVYHLNDLLKENKNKEFWDFSLRIMRNSSVFKTMMLHEVQPHWHREMNMKELYLIINKYNKYLEEMPTNLKHRRVYLPKLVDPETGLIIKYRPLGVPTLAWRLYLHTWQFFLMIFLQNRIPGFQHGFYKGRGTKTAWEEVLLKTINAKCIYEFDFEQFFPSVNASMLSALLQRKGMPKEISNYLLDLHLSYPKVETLDESKLDETNSLYKAELDHIGLLHTKFKEEFSVPNFVLNQSVEIPNWNDNEVVKNHLATLLDLDIMMINFGIEVNENLDNYLKIIYDDRTDNPTLQETIKSIMVSRREVSVPEPSIKFNSGETKSENLSYENFMSDYKGKVLQPIKEFINSNTTEGYFETNLDWKPDS